MRGRTALLLTAFGALVLAAGLVFGGSFQPEQTRLPAGTLMFPNLAASLAGARRIEILQHGDHLVLALPKSAGAWVLPDHADFPIEPADLHAMLAGLVALRLMEPRTSQPELFGRLGLADPARPDADGTLIRVLAADGAPIAAVILGHDVAADSAVGAEGTAPPQIYVRAPAERHSWLAEPAVAASADWHDWVRHDIIDIRPDDVARIVARRGDAPAIMLERQGDRLVVVAPPTHPPLDRFKVDDMSRALANLDLLDVRPAQGAPGDDLGTTTLTTTHGLAVSVDLVRDGEALWVSLDAEGTPEAAALRARLAGWSFRIAPEKEAALLPTLQDLAAYASPLSQAMAPAPVATRPGSRR